MQSSLFQVGHNTGQTIEVALNDMRSEALGGVSAGAGASQDTHQLTLSGSFAVGDIARLTLTDADSKTYEIEFKATAVSTGAQMLAEMQTYAVENFGQKFGFDLHNNTLTVTSHQGGVAGRFTAAENGTVAPASGAGVSTLTNTVVGKEAVAVAQVEKVGIAGGVADTKIVTLTITQDTDGNGFGTVTDDGLYGGANSTGNTVVTITHTADGAMNADDIAAKLAGKNHSGYTFEADGNNLIVKTNAAGSGGAFKVSITDNTTTATAGNNIVLTEAKTLVTALDGIEGPSGTTISQIRVTDRDAAAAAILTIDSALKTVGQERAKLGAFQNRLTHAVNNMTNMSANTSAARSVVADADYAAESSSLAKNQILQQAGTAMLAQANAQAQSVLSLLK